MWQVGFCLGVCVAGHLIGFSNERPYLMQGQKLMYQESDHNPRIIVIVEHYR